MFCHLQPLIRLQECFRPPANCTPTVSDCSPGIKSPPAMGRGKQGVGTKRCGDVCPGKCRQAEKERREEGPGDQGCAAGASARPGTCAGCVQPRGSGGTRGTALFGSVCFVPEPAAGQRERDFSPGTFTFSFTSTQAPLPWELESITRSPLLAGHTTDHGGRLW